jgi:acetyl esterase/lipase
LEANIKYGDGPTLAGSIPLLLDFYRPNQPCNVARPTVVFVHGGGFQSGSRKGGNVTAMADELAPLGINLISIQYRLQGDNPAISTEFAAFERDYQAMGSNEPAERIRAFTAAVEDTVRTLRWMQSNASQFCIDPNRIGLWGSSAGAYTVLHAGYALDRYNIQRPVPRVIVDYWGGLFRDSDLEAGEAPLFVLHGTADATVAYSEATQITDRAAIVRVPHTFYTVIGGGHDYQGIGFATVSVDGQSLTKKTAAFVDAHMRTNGTPVYERRELPR